MSSPSSSQPSSTSSFSKTLPTGSSNTFDLVGFLDQYKFVIAGILAAGIVGGLGYVTVGYVKARAEKSAQEAFYPLEKQYTEKRAKFDQARIAGITGQNIDELLKEGAAVRASGDLSKDYGTLIDEMETFANDKKGTAAGTQAALFAAETRIQYEQADKASAMLHSTVEATKASSLIGGLARMASGNAFAAAGKCDEALKSWEQVLSAKPLAFLHGEAALRAGLCFEKSGDKAKALEMYRKASSESEQSQAAKTARSLMRALELGS
ncbi:MAG: tetratricopeptide repeat protein [Bdellovibrionales bacterium]|jgi:predicted negative regulator of RcsB-dependent stress response|nr:tetratricopeptide repeat protein [Bdellovibrionales bacterium]